MKHNGQNTPDHPASVAMNRELGALGRMGQDVADMYTRMLNTYGEIVELNQSLQRTIAAKDLEIAALKAETAHMRTSPVEEEHAP